MYTKRSVVEVVGRSELHTPPVMAGGSWGRVGKPLGWGVSAVVGGTRVLSISAAVATSQLDVVTDLTAAWRPATFHSSLAALKPISLALQNSHRKVLESSECTVPMTLCCTVGTVHCISRHSFILYCLPATAAHGGDAMQCKACHECCNQQCSLL